MKKLKELNQKMRILYLIQSFPKISETFILNEIVGLTNAGHEITVLAKKKPFTKVHSSIERNNLFKNVIYSHVNKFNRGYKKLLSGITSIVFQFISKPSQTIKYIKYLCTTQTNIWSGLDTYFSMQKLVNKKFDLIHVSFPTYDLLENAYFLSKFFNCQFSLTFRAHDIYRKSNVESLKKRLSLVKQASGIITISNYNKTYLKSTFGINAEYVVYDAIDISLFKPSNVKRKKKILAVGRFVKQKGIVYLLEACNLLHKKGVSYECILIGDGPEIKQYKKLIAEKNIPNIIFKGILTADEVKDELSEASVFVLPCIMAVNGDCDILANVLKEAMAMEIPVITSNIRGVEELVDNNISGFLVPPNNSVVIANAIQKILDSSANINRFGKMGRKKIVESFNTKKEVKKLETIFQNIVNK